MEYHNNIVKKMCDNNFSNIAPFLNNISELYKRIAIKCAADFIGNAKSFEDEKLLIEVLNSIQVYNNQDCINAISHEISTTMVDIIESNNYVILFKEDINSRSHTTESSNSYISLQLTYHFLNPKNRLYPDKNNEFSTHKSNIIICDDISLTGSTFIKAIDKISYCENKEIHIFCYLYSQYAIEKLEEYGNSKNYNIIIHNFVEVNYLQNALSLESDNYYHGNFKNKFDPQKHFNGHDRFALPNDQVPLCLNQLTSPNNNPGIIWIDNYKYDGKIWIPLASRRFDMYFEQTKIISASKFLNIPLDDLTYLMSHNENIKTYLEKKNLDSKVNFAEVSEFVMRKRNNNSFLNSYIKNKR